MTGAAVGAGTVSVLGGETWLVVPGVTGVGAGAAGAVGVGVTSSVVAGAGSVWGASCAQVSLGERALNPAKHSRVAEDSTHL